MYKSTVNKLVCKCCGRKIKLLTFVKMLGIMALLAVSIFVVALTPFILGWFL